ncbi:MAG: PIG-L family deacetylase [Thermoguttaceae bacterium]|jgi:LmbE family N-acetylglucosaminyl deacetylase|nr:PIG-L family deacetylase [Thermoguttaceae bacterium]
MRKLSSLPPRLLASVIFIGTVALSSPSEPGGWRANADEAAKPAAGRAAGNPVGAVRDREDGKLGIVVFGAHPDDAEIRAGGVGAMWAAQGHDVQMVSVTNGDIGHFAMAGGALAQRRTAEVEEASRILGTTATVLDIHDGELEPTLENRRTLTRIIRRWNADIVIGHRPNDYHPDHRYVGVLMQDCAFMVGVPFFCPDVPPLPRNPVFLFSYDGFQYPAPFRADIVVAIDDVIDKKVESLVVMESQFVEGGALGKPNPALDDPAEREKKREQVRANFRRRFAGIADKYRDKLIELYGEEAGKKVQYAEAFEICEYGRRPSAEDIRKLFPFFPK